MMASETSGNPITQKPRFGAKRDPVAVTDISATGDTLRPDAKNKSSRDDNGEAADYRVDEGRHQDLRAAEHDGRRGKAGERHRRDGGEPECGYEPGEAK